MNPLLGLRDDLDSRKAQGLYRQRRVIDGPQGVSIQCDGRELLSFCSNDYLGLANEPRVAEAMREGTRRYGVGSGAAHLISGHSAAHHALEEELAELLGAQRALLFSTGYMANVGVLSALLGRGDTLLQDKLNHASLIDGATLCGAKLKRYRHADMDGLGRMLASVLDGAEGNCLVASDGVFSMDGDVAPLDEMAGLAGQHDAALMVDDAHGFGVLGERGRGSVAAAGLGFDEVPIYMATLGKALGTAGAFVAGSETLIETLIQRARSYVYTTAMPAALAEATRASLRIAAEEQWRRDHLQALVQRFREGAQSLGLQLMASRTPIQPIVLGEAETALAWSNALLEQGILVTPIRPPTVPQGSARLRVTFSAAHELAQVDRLLDTLRPLAEVAA
jgi:8-amino-7-oxononanoate synthase